MKAHIHPPYRTVVFHDTSANEYFKVGSTIRTDRVIELRWRNFSVCDDRRLLEIASILHGQTKNLRQ